MDFIQQLFDAFTAAFLSLGQGFLAIVPNIVVALIFFAIGWVLAALLEHMIISLFKALKVDAALKSAGIQEVVERAGHKLNSGLFVGVIVKWFVILVFLIASFDTLHLPQVSAFLSRVVAYLPQVIVAVLILMAAVVVANVMQKLVVASAKAARVKSSELLGRVTKWSIWIFAIIAALVSLNVAVNLIYIIIQMVMAGAALAIGLAFGLGGKEVAQKLLEKTVTNITEKE